MSKNQRDEVDVDIRFVRHFLHRQVVGTRITTLTIRCVGQRCITWCVHVLSLSDYAYVNCVEKDRCLYEVILMIMLWGKVVRYPTFRSFHLGHSHQPGTFTRTG